jgi:hypothetical protein
MFPNVCHSVKVTSTSYPNATAHWGNHQAPVAVRELLRSRLRRTSGWRPALLLNTAPICRPTEKFRGESRWEERSRYAYVCGARGGRVRLCGRVCVALEGGAGARSGTARTGGHSGSTRSGRRAAGGESRRERSDLLRARSAHSSPDDEVPPRRRGGGNRPRRRRQRGRARRQRARTRAPVGESPRRRARCRPVHRRLRGAVPGVRRAGRENDHGLGEPAGLQSDDGRRGRGRSGGGMARRLHPSAGHGAPGSRTRDRAAPDRVG